MRGTISEVDVRDEFGVLDEKASISDVAGNLHANSVKVVLVRSKKQIAGVITQQHFLRVCATGIDPQRTKAVDHLQTSLLHLRYDTPIPDAIAQIEEIEPDAVIVINEEGRPMGYLSPEDYRLLKDVKMEEAPTKVKDVLRLVSSSAEGDEGGSMPLPNQDATMAIATRGSTEGHGVRQLHIDGARIETETALLRQGDRTISLWPLRSVEETEGSLRSYLEIVADASSDGALVMLMDAKSAKQRLGQQTWDQLVAAADEYIGVDQG